MNPFFSMGLSAIKNSLISLILIYLVISYLSEISGSTSTFDLGGEPHYSIIVETNKNQLNQNDNFKMNLSFSGLGNVSFSRLFILVPDNIIKDKIIKVTKINYTCSDINFTTNTKICKGEPIVRNESPRFWTLIPNNYYQHPHIVGEDQYSGTKLEGAAPFSFSEVMYSPNSSMEYYPPVTIDFVVAGNAKPGDYNIQIIYDYKSKDEWYQDRQETKIHINRFYENDTFLYYTQYFAILGFIVLIMQFCKDIKTFWNWSKNKNH